MQFTHRILAFDWLLNNRVWWGPVKSFAFKSSVRLGWRNFALIAWYACVSSAEPSGIFSCILLISNQMIFHVKFGINKQRPQILSVSKINSFFLLLIYSKLHSKSCDYLYKVKVKIFSRRPTVHSMGYQTRMAFFLLFSFFPFFLFLRIITL